MSVDQSVISLHKYYLNAGRMRVHFKKELEKVRALKGMKDLVEVNLYMHLWYGCLRVVVEGWESMGLKDPKVTGLWDIEKIKLLNGLRNDVFHFQPSYVPSRTLKAIEDKTFVNWVHSIHEAIGAALLARMQASESKN